MFCNSWPSILCFLEKLTPSDNIPTVMGEGLLTATPWFPPQPPFSLIQCHLPLERHSSFGNAPAFSFGKSKGTLHDSDLWFFFLSMGIRFIHLFLKVRIWIVIRIGIILLSLINRSLTDRNWSFLEKRNQNWLVRHLPLVFSSLWNKQVLWGKANLAWISIATL